MEQTNQTMEVTWGIALQIWWWITWRFLLVSLVSDFVLGFTVGFILVLIGLDFFMIQMILFPFSIMLGIGINVFFFKKIIGKKFKDFTFVLLKTE